LTNLDEVKKEREGLENDLKSVNFDMTSKFLTALAQDGVINEEALSVTELDRIYGSLTNKVQESLKKQEGLLKNIQVKFIYLIRCMFKKLQKGYGCTKLMSI
jgi:programmed cell death 6-interacting protein